MAKKKTLRLPEHWDMADDSLSQYLAIAQRKVLNTYDEEREYYVRLRRISDCFDRMGWGMYERPELLAPIFRSRSHAAFMAADDSKSDARRKEVRRAWANSRKSKSVIVLPFPVLPNCRRRCRIKYRPSAPDECRFRARLSTQNPYRRANKQVFVFKCPI